jgi:DNA-binding LytR/AlgR family response regulator
MAQSAAANLIAGPDALIDKLWDQRNRLQEVVAAHSGEACEGGTNDSPPRAPRSAVQEVVQPVFEAEKLLSAPAQERRPNGGPGPLRVVARRKKSLVFLDPTEIWAFEASERLSFVHSRQGKFDIDLSLAAIETSFGRSLIRVHRNWLVNLAFARELDRDGNETTLFVGASIGDESQGVRVPVSRDRAQALRNALLANATGVRRF